MINKTKRNNRKIISRMQKSFFKRVKSAKKEVNSNTPKSKLDSVSSICLIVSALLLVFFHVTIIIIIQFVPWICNLFKLENPIETNIISTNLYIYVGLFLFGMMVIFMILFKIGLGRSSSFYEQMNIKRTAIIEDLLKEEMQRAKLKDEFAFISMIGLNYDGVSIKAKLIAWALNIIFISISIVEFPAFDPQKDSSLILIILIASNYFCSEIINWIIEKVKEPIYFYDVLINQYAIPKIKKMSEEESIMSIDFGRDIRWLKEQNEKQKKVLEEKNQQIQQLQNENKKLKQENKKQLRKK